mmetsp:Transcript_14796/g.50435  ORF Transcript_14796/g.50435 Transcript_14796/m.50435 type:complete len:103 (+) Transcript_14796:478-786(+)
MHQTVAVTLGQASNYRSGSDMPASWEHRGAPCWFHSPRKSSKTWRLKCPGLNNHEEVGKNKERCCLTCLRQRYCEETSHISCQGNKDESGELLMTLQMKPWR